MSGDTESYQADRHKVAIILTVCVYRIPSLSCSKVPAYKRFQSLADPVALTSDLPLPPSYALLAERFRCTDTVVNMLQKRHEMPTFNKLKKAVQKMSRR